MPKYLVTGGCGFIGSHLVDALVALGHEVRVIDNLSTGQRGRLSPQAELIVADAGDPAVLAAAMRDVAGCFHLAAIASVQLSVERWLETHRANQSMAVAVFEAAGRAPGGKVPVVYASSAAVYGDNAADRLDESMTPMPLSAYAADKLGCEMHGRVAWGVHGIPNTALRLFNVYGPGQDPASPYSGVISIFAAAAMAGRPLTIHGDGSQVRDFIFVRDVVEHMVAAMLRQPAGHRVYNVCTGAATSIGELARLIGGILGVNLQISHAPARLGDIRHSLGDPAMAIAALGLRAVTPLAQGLRATLQS